MTLQQFFDVLSANPSIILFYFLALPVTAVLCGIFGKNEGHLSPWKYVYCTLLYMAAVPGIFAVFLNVYFFLFERKPIMSTNIYTQILPILAMLLCFFIIRKNVDLRQVPGFERLTGLVLIVSAVIGAMWILDRMHIITFTYLPFGYVILVIVVLFILIRFGWKRVIAK